MLTGVKQVPSDITDITLLSLKDFSNGVVGQGKTVYVSVQARFTCLAMYAIYARCVCVCFFVRLIVVPAELKPVSRCVRGCVMSRA